MRRTKSTLRLKARWISYGFKLETPKLNSYNQTHMLMDLMWVCMDSYGFEYGFIVSAPWGVRWELVYGLATIGGDWVTCSRLIICSNRDNAAAGQLRSYRHPRAPNTRPLSVRVRVSSSNCHSHDCTPIGTSAHELVVFSCESVLGRVTARNRGLNLAAITGD